MSSMINIGATVNLGWRQAGSCQSRGLLPTLPPDTRVSRLGFPRLVRLGLSSVIRVRRDNEAISTGRDGASERVINASWLGRQGPGGARKGGMACCSSSESSSNTKDQGQRRHWDEVVADISQEPDIEATHPADQDHQIIGHGHRKQ